MKSTAYTPELCSKCITSRHTPSIFYRDVAEHDRLDTWWQCRGRYSTEYERTIRRCHGCATVTRYRMKVMVLAMMRLGVRL